MGSINDYLRSRRRMDDQPRAHRIKTRLLGQISLSLVLFLIIAASIQADNFLGDSARYVAGEGVAASSSWIDFSGESQQTPPNHLMILMPVSYTHLAGQCVGQGNVWGRS